MDVTTEMRMANEKMEQLKDLVEKAMNDIINFETWYMKRNMVSKIYFQKKCLSLEHFDETLS